MGPLPENDRSVDMAAAIEPLALHYTAQWIALGVVTLDDIRRDQHAAAHEDDRHPEHYRWRAFCRFLELQQPLSAHLAHQLYALGAADADPSMGGSMMGGSFTPSRLS